LSKFKVTDMAMEFGISTDEVMGLLRQMDVPVRGPASLLSDDQVARIRLRWEREKRQRADRQSAPPPSARRRKAPADGATATAPCAAKSAKTAKSVKAAKAPAPAPPVADVAPSGVRRRKRADIAPPVEASAPEVEVIVAPPSEVEPAEAFTMPDIEEDVAVEAPPTPPTEIFINKTTGDFVGRTGMPPWAAAATRHNRMELQPLALLKQRRILETTLRHELVHVVIEAVGGSQTPRWLAEGMALHLAGEGKLLDQRGNVPVIAPKELEQKLANAKTAAEMKEAYAVAYRTVRELIRVEGENKLWQRVAQRSYDVSASRGRQLR
jgi:hypothetical protein